MRAPGKRTSQEDLQSWKAVKLFQQINSNVRVDFGGKDPVEFIGAKLDEIITVATPETRQILVSMIVELMKGVAEGSRKRISNKTAEGLRRCLKLEKIEQTATTKVTQKKNSQNLVALK